MLKKINEGKVESDDGFSVHITSLECLKYEEKDRFVEIDWAYDHKMNKTYFYFSDVKDWDKPLNRKITDNERKTILKNITEALKLLQGEFEVV